MPKKPTLIILLGCFVLLLVACRSETLLFIGESENWSAELKATQTGDTQRQRFQLRYTGENLEQISNIDYDVEVGASGRLGGSGDLLNASGVFLRSPDRCTNDVCTFIDEESEVKVTVKWAGTEENFVLVIEK